MRRESELRILLIHYRTDAVRVHSLSLEKYFVRGACRHGRDSWRAWIDLLLRRFQSVEHLAGNAGRRRENAMAALRQDEIQSGFVRDLLHRRDKGGDVLAGGHANIQS